MPEIAIMLQMCKGTRHSRTLRKVQKIVFLTRGGSRGDRVGMWVQRLNIELEAQSHFKDLYKIPSEKTPTSRQKQAETFENELYEIRADLERSDFTGLKP